MGHRTELLLTSAVAIGCLFVATAASAISLSFDSEPGSYIEFSTSGTFSFQDEVPGSFDDIRITASDTFGTAVGLTGDIDGIFTIGTINKHGLQQIASLDGIGQIAFDDGAGFAMIGSVSFGSVSTLGLSINSTMRLFGLAYGGDNPDLLVLANGRTGVLEAEFTAPITGALADLIAAGAQIEDYSGAVFSEATPPVPEPSAALCFAVGSLIVGGAIRRR